MKFDKLVNKILNESLGGNESKAAIIAKQMLPEIEEELEYGDLQPFEVLEGVYVRVKKKTGDTGLALSVLMALRSFIVDEAELMSDDDFESFFNDIQ